MTGEPYGIDWSLTTWEGSRREQIRRWSELTMDEILAAQEEMADLAEKLGPSHNAAPATVFRVAEETPGDRGDK